MVLVYGNLELFLKTFQGRTIVQIQTQIPQLSVPELDVLVELYRTCKASIRAECLFEDRKYTVEHTGEVFAVLSGSKDVHHTLRHVVGATCLIQDACQLSPEGFVYFGFTHQKISQKELVRLAGLEPAAPRSQSECATKLRHTPL